MWRLTAAYPTANNRQTSPAARNMPGAPMVTPWNTMGLVPVTAARGAAAATTKNTMPTPARTPPRRAPTSVVVSCSLVADIEPPCGWVGERSRGVRVVDHNYTFG